MGRQSSVRFKSPQRRRSGRSFFAKWETHPAAAILRGCCGETQATDEALQRAGRCLFLSKRKRRRLTTRQFPAPTGAQLRPTALPCAPSRNPTKQRTLRLPNLRRKMWRQQLPNHSFGSAADYVNASYFFWGGLTPRRIESLLIVGDIEAAGMDTSRKFDVPGSTGSHES